ncbi:hypothetical protein V7O62_04030 [Methanolobus sp. ZRKC2]|uniref:hypothetical protein n=1 Tax=Methanolobus sp. ZRKC2 TaxID=3125783 RepID=UPI0032549CB1
MWGSKRKYKITFGLVLFGSYVIALAGLMVPFLIGQSNLALLGTYLAVPMLLAPLVYSLQTKNASYLPEMKEEYFKLFLSTYFIFFSISLLLLHINQIRPYSYYGIIAIMGMLILSQILFFKSSQKRSQIILFQTMLLLVNVIWGVSLNYFFFIERTDAFFHTQMIEILVEGGQITELFDLYASFPLWHILGASVYMVTALDTSAYKIMYLTNGIIFAFIPPAAYLLSKKIFKEEKLSLVAALFVAFYPDILKYGLAAIARSTISFVLIILVLSLLYNRDTRKIFLALILTISIIAYHTVSIPFVLAILVLVYVLQKIYSVSKEQSIADFDYLAFVVAATLGYWIYIAMDLFKTIFRNLMATAPTSLSTDSILVTPLQELFNYLQYSPILFFVLIGTLEAMKRENVSESAKMICLTGLLATAVSFPGPGFLISKFGEHLNIERFGEYTFLFIVMAAAFGFYTTYLRSKKNAKRILILLFIVLAFLSVSNDFVASDNPIVKRPFYTYYLTEEEINGFDHAGTHAKGRVMVDFVTHRYMETSPYVEKINILEVDPTEKEFLRSNTSEPILIRTGELSKRPLKLATIRDGEFIATPTMESLLDYYYLEDSELWGSLEEYNKIYESSSVTTYV